MAIRVKRSQREKDDIRRALGLTKRMTLQDRVAEWHANRWPDAEPANVIAKLFEEGGEVSRAVNTGRGSTEEEAGDVGIVMMVLLGRFYPEVNFVQAIEDRFRYITDPANGHRTLTAER